MVQAALCPSVLLAQASLPSPVPCLSSCNPARCLAVLVANQASLHWARAVCPTCLLPTSPRAPVLKVVVCQVQVPRACQ